MRTDGWIEGREPTWSRITLTLFLRLRSPGRQGRSRRRYRARVLYPLSVASDVDKTPQPLSQRCKECMVFRLRSHERPSGELRRRRLGNNLEMGNSVRAGRMRERERANIIQRQSSSSRVTWPRGGGLSPDTAEESPACEGGK